MMLRKFAFWRVLFSVVISLGATLVTLEMARSVGAGSIVNYPIHNAQNQLREPSQAVQDYRAKHGHLPASLEVVTVRIWKEKSVSAAEIRDSIGQPFHYIRKGNTFQIVSYGRDGKPGGTWLDADISSDNLKPPEARLTLWRFLQEPVFAGMKITALLSGLVIFYLMWDVLNPGDWQERKFAKLFWRLSITVFGALFAAIFMTLLYVPSGH